MPRKLPWDEDTTQSRKISKVEHTAAKPKNKIETHESNEKSDDLFMRPGLEHDDKYMMTDVELDTIAALIARDHYKQIYQSLNDDPPTFERTSSLEQLLTSPKRKRKYVTYTQRDIDVVKYEPVVEEKLEVKAEQKVEVKKQPMAVVEESIVIDDDLAIMFDIQPAHKVVSKFSKDSNGVSLKQRLGLL